MTNFRRSIVASTKWKELSAVRKFLVKRGMKVKLGRWKPEGFIEPVTFYLFWCSCGNPSKGYINKRLKNQQLHCSDCGKGQNTKSSPLIVKPV